MSQCLLPEFFPLKTLEIFGNETSLMMKKKVSKLKLLPYLF